MHLSVSPSPPTCALADFFVLSAIQETLKFAGSSEKPLRARVMGYKKPRGAQRSAEKAEAAEGIQSAEEGGSALWKASKILE